MKMILGNAREPSLFCMLTHSGGEGRGKKKERRNVWVALTQPCFLCFGDEINQFSTLSCQAILDLEGHASQGLGFQIQLFT